MTKEERMIVILKGEIINSILSDEPNFKGTLDNENDDIVTYIPNPIIINSTETYLGVTNENKPETFAMDEIVITPEMELYGRPFQLDKPEKRDYRDLDSIPLLQLIAKLLGIETPVFDNFVKNYISRNE